VGTLRAYIIQYLRQHPLVHQQLTFLVRQLAPTPEGLPIEIYVFSRETAWAVYEGIQADIFDHILAMVPEFGLRVFQKPSGADLVPLAGRLQESPGQGKFSGAGREFPSFTQI
jgi:miniconductance mechanosensitive channel